MKDTTGIKGMVKLECKSAEGKVLWTMPLSHNIITNVGKSAFIARAFGLGTDSAFAFLQLGTGTTAEAATQTALTTPITTSGLAIHTGAVSITTTTTTSDTVRTQYTWTATGTQTVQEIGLFNASVSGIMLGRKLTGAKVVNSTETLTATYDIIIS
jgi:hypothetical protein